MSHNEAQTMNLHETVISPNLTEGFTFPILELSMDGFSPNSSSYTVSEAGSSDVETHSTPSEVNVTTPNRLTVALLGTTSPAATFDLTAWQWNNSTNVGMVDSSTPRQRTLSILTVHGAPVPAPILRPIPATVPETLPSLYAPSRSGDEDYDDEDDCTEADSIFFCNVDQQGPKIRTEPSVPSAMASIIELEVGFNAPEAFDDFEDLAIIVAALRDADEILPAVNGEV